MKVDLLNVDYCIRVNVCVIHMYEMKKSVSDMNVQGEKFKRYDSCLTPKSNVKNQIYFSLRFQFCCCSFFVGGNLR